MTNDYGNLELHKVLLSAMKDIDKICRENGLKYFLYAGTLLGAVNYKGFIPWDDDVDIVMFPEDFRKFQTIIETQFHERYTLQTFDSDPQWFSKMNKLQINGTTVISSVGEEHPLFIDICILHNFPQSGVQKAIQRKQIELINLILAVQSGAIIPTSLRSKLTLGNLAKLKKSFWGKHLDHVLCKYDTVQTTYVGIMCNTLTKNPYTGRTGYDTDKTERIWHLHPQEIEFEGQQFMTFSQIEVYLAYQYGPHYMDPYPEEKRITKHDVKTYEISQAVRERAGL